MAARYTAHIGLAPSFKLTGLQISCNPEVSLSQICFIAPHNCCAFCQVFIAQCLRFRGLFSISSHLPENGLKRAYHGAPTLWLHISSRPVRILQYSVFKQAFISYALKIILHTPLYNFISKNSVSSIDVSRPQQ